MILTINLSMPPPKEGRKRRGNLRSKKTLCFFSKDKIYDIVITSYARPSSSPDRYTMIIVCAWCFVRPSCSGSALACGILVEQGRGRWFIATSEAYVYRTYRYEGLDWQQAVALCSWGSFRVFSSRLSVSIPIHRNFCCCAYVSFSWWALCCFCVLCVYTFHFHDAVSVVLLLLMLFVLCVVDDLTFSWLPKKAVATRSTKGVKQIEVQ